MPATLPGDGDVWLKCESLQHAGSFKLRGAYTFVQSLSEAERSAGLVTYSSGNHAQAVAWTGRSFGVPATIVMPVDAPAVKLEGTRRLGGQVEQVGTTTLERKARAEEIARDTGATIVPPFDHPAIIAGQGTVGLEIREQLATGVPRHRDGASADPALVLVPIGGGGLVSGVAAAMRRLFPAARVVGVEPEGAPKMSRSLAAGEPITLDSIHTVADGLKPVRPGELTFRHCRELVERVITVSDEEILEAVRFCWRRRLVVEPSGAAGLAPLLAGRLEAPPAREGATVAVLSGGNVESRRLAEWTS